MRNLRVTMTEGEIKTVWFKLEPTNLEGVTEALNLTGATVTFRVTRGNETIIDWSACTPDPDQTTNTGEGTFILNNVALVENEYRLRIRAVKDSVPYFFPTLPNRTYGLLKVLPQ